MNCRIVRRGMLLALLSFTSPQADAQTPSKEYIRVNGRLVAIENAGAALTDNSMPAASQPGPMPSSVVISSAFTATVRMKNNGTTTWTATDYKLAATGSTAADFGISGPISFPSGTTTVAPNGEVSFVIAGTARSTTCPACPFSWKMSKTGVVFGSEFATNVDITGPTGINVSPSTTVTLNRGQSSSFTASITNSSNLNLNWTNPAQGSFQSTTTQSGNANVYTAPTSVSANSSVTGSVCSAATPTACASIPIQLNKINLTLNGPSLPMYFGVGSSAYSVSLSGLSPTASRGVLFEITSTNSSRGSFASGSEVTSITLNVDGGTNPSGVTPTVTYYPPTCAGTCPSPTITIQARSVQDSTQLAQVQFTVTQPQQLISGAVFDPQIGRETKLDVNVSDPTNQANISSAEFLLSTIWNTNQYPPGQTCRFRVYRTGGTFHIQLDDWSGTGNFGADYTIGSNVIVSNGACKLLLAQSSGSLLPQPNQGWHLTIKISSITMGDVRHLRGSTTANGSSAPFPSSYLSAIWLVLAAPTFSVTNSQGLTPPQLNQGATVTLSMQVTDLCGTCVSKFKLAQALDGNLTHTNPAPAPYQAQAVYSAGNTGQDRDILVRLIVYKNLTAWQNEDPNNIDYESPTPYTVRMISSTSGPPTLIFFNPITSSDSNPLPRDTTVVANGSGTTFISYGVKNGNATTNFPAATCNQIGACWPISDIYFNINKSFTESGLAQDKANGCRLRLVVYPAYPSLQTPVSFGAFLGDDPGQYETTNGTWYQPGTITLQNSQCKVELDTSVGAYGKEAPTDSTVLGIRLRFTFMTPFVGQRYVFMKAQRAAGEWTGWLFRGVYTMQ